MHWPARITARGEVRTQYAHVIDMMPTVLDVLDIEPPATIKGVPQSPIHGVSFAHTFDDPAVETKRHTQYFEMLGHRSIYHDGWRAVCPWPGPSFAEAAQPFGSAISADTLSQLDATGWELYHVAEDFAETRNLAADNRPRLIALIGTWYAEAGKYNVLPLDGSVLDRTSSPAATTVAASSWSSSTSNVLVPSLMPARQNRSRPTGVASANGSPSHTNGTEAGNHSSKKPSSLPRPGGQPHERPDERETAAPG